MSAPASTLSGWECSSFTGAGVTYDVFAKSAPEGGPGVVFIPEIPGLTPEVLAFGDHLVAAGFSVVIPSLFGTPGKPVSGGYLRACHCRQVVRVEGDEGVRGPK